METALQQARFFVLLGYDRAAVISQLESQFSEEEAKAAYEQAAEQAAKSEAELARQIEAHDRAIKSEHDPDVSIHDEDAS